jgi:hypothetical protein
MWALSLVVAFLLGIMVQAEGVPLATAAREAIRRGLVSNDRRSR